MLSNGPPLLPVLEGQIGHEHLALSIKLDYVKVIIVSNDRERLLCSVAN